MEYENYRVPRDEKIEVVAKQFGISVMKIKELNPNLKTFKSFWVEYIPYNTIVRVFAKNTSKGKQSLTNKDDLLSQEQESFFPSYSWGKDGKYQIDISSYLTLGNGKVNETQSNEIWSISFNKDNLLDITTSAKKYIRIDSQLKSVYELIEIVNRAFQHMILRLDEDKTILKVVNEDEIKKNWSIIKKNDLRFYELIKDSYKEIITSYDGELNRITENIRANILYQILFFPYLKIKHSQTMWRHLKKEKTVSIFFPNEKVEYETQYKTDKEEGLYRIKINGYNKRVSESINNFSTQYTQKYEGLLKISLKYSFVIEGDYYYDEFGILKKALFHVKESLNEAMYYACKYEIKQMI